MADAGSSPMTRTARPGVTPNSALSRPTRSRHPTRILAATSRPSMIFADFKWPSRITRLASPALPPAHALSYQLRLWCRDHRESATQRNQDGRTVFSPPPPERPARSVGGVLVGPLGAAVFLPPPPWGGGRGGGGPQMGPRCAAASRPPPRP